MVRDITHPTRPWLVDVIAPDRKTAGRMIANFRQVVKEGELRLYPQIGGPVQPLLPHEFPTDDRLGQSCGAHITTLPPMAAAPSAPSPKPSGR